MSLSIGPTPPFSAGFVATTEPRRPIPAEGHASEALKAAFDVDLAEVVPAVPPFEVQREVQFASQRAARMAAEEERELHFTVDEETGRVIVQVRDLEGNVLQTIPGTKALDVMAGLEDL